VTWFARVKTTIQMVAIVVLLANPPDLTRPWVITGYALLYLAAVMTLISMVLYIQAAWPTLRQGLTQQGSGR
jgi:CDP-diacylglycerol--glycerol-3-phosphate 3-phosphatidyltransferase